MLFWGALPFVMPQALYVRMFAPRFPPAAGPTFGSSGRGRPLRLIGIGDSIIAGVGAGRLRDALIGQTARALAANLQARVRWSALGRNGANSRIVIQRLLPELPPDRADVFVLSVGVNDVTSLTRITDWRKNVDQLLCSLRAHSPHSFIAVAGLPPMHEFPLLPEPLRVILGMRARTLDETLRDVVVAADNSIFIDLDFDASPEKFADDGYHPSVYGYREYGETMARRIAAALADNR
jgi:lysophospholipase L1-like esterase